MPSAYFVVRATVTDPAKRKAFDTWYQKEHSQTRPNHGA
jgi:hypothetical protein